MMRRRHAVVSPDKALLNPPGDLPGRRDPG